MQRLVLIKKRLLVLLLGCLLQYTHGKDDGSKFLYLQDPPDPDFPIQEYQGSDDQPAFLFDADYPNPRIVEFYAHWCPHCRHFKPHYIEFAKKLRDITEHLPDHVQVETFAVSCVPNKEICNKMNINGYPTLKMYQAHSINGTQLSLGGLDPRKILQGFGIQTDQYSSQKVKAGKIRSSNNRGKDSKEPPNLHFMARSKKETFEDAHLSLDFLLRNGVYTAPGPLSPSARTALQAFVGVILPLVLPSSSSMHPVVSELSKKREQIVKSEQSLMEILDSLEAPPAKTWSPACLQHGTGYTCGLWTLFHIVTVGMVEWNMEMADPRQRLSPLEVGDALRNFIEHFFQCDECRAHFLSEYDDCHHDRCNRLTSDKDHSTFKEWKELPLWLYETHNGVNVRLRQERLANKEAEDTTDDWQVQWPPVQECPKCWLSHGRWDEEQVYNYLRLQYWPEDYKTSRLQDELKTRKKDDTKKKDQRQNDRNNDHHHDHNDHATDDLHPDVAMAILKQQQTSVDLEAPPIPWQFMTLVLLSILFGYTWHRKRTFDLKGYHKKRESDEIC